MTEDLPDKAVVRERIDREIGFENLTWQRAEPAGEHILDAVETAQATLDGHTYWLVRATVATDGQQGQQLPLVFTEAERKAFGSGVQAGEFDELSE